MASEQRNKRVPVVNCNAKVTLGKDERPEPGGQTKLPCGQYVPTDTRERQTHHLFVLGPHGNVFCRENCENSFDSVN